MGNTESILAPMAGEEAIVPERLASVTSAGEGEIVAISRHSEGNNNFIPKNLLLSNQEDIVGLAFQLNNEKSIQSYPSPEFLNSLSFIKKFYPVLNLLHAPRIPQKQRGCSLLHLLAIRTHSISSVRKFALPAGAREKFIKVSHDNSCNSRHSERQRRNLAYYYNTIKLQGENMNNLIKNNNTSIPNIGGVGTPPYVDKLALDVGLVNPTYFAVYPSKSSLIREDLCYSKVVHYNNFNLTETVHSPFTTHNSLKKSAFTLAEVLITFGIIGIVAALTLPVVMSKYQEHVLKQQFKKAYSNFSQVLLQVQAQDFDMSVPNCYYLSDTDGMLQNSVRLTDDCSKVRDGILKRLKVIKTCSNKAYENGCIPDYKGYDTMSIERNPDLSEDDALNIVRGQPGFYRSVIHNLSPAYDLADGTILFEYYVSPSYFPCLFAIDINGKKGPNKWGYDLFSFYTVSDGKMYKLQPTCYMVDKGGKTSEQMIRDMFK